MPNNPNQPGKSPEHKNPDQSNPKYQQTTGPKPKSGMEQDEDKDRRNKDQDRKSGNYGSDQNRH